VEIIYTQPDCLPASVTIFAIPKPFVGHIGLIQHNAIASWTKLNPRPEIFLYGDEQGTKDICQELELIHVPQIQRNEYGTPLLDGVFAQTCDRSNNKIIAYLNADIILKDDFLTAVSSCDRELDDYLLIGRRWDIDLNEKLDFEAEWEAKLKRLIQEHGCLADYDCKDYFVFPKHLFAQIPKFAVGRGYWDTWMVTQTLGHNYPVVDCSLAITAIHQNHPYTHIRGGRNEAYMGREAQINKALGKITQPGNIACATWQLKPAAYRDSPLVSIIILAQGNCMNLERAILSILTQDFDDYEIIVVNLGCDQAFKQISYLDVNRVKYYFWGTASQSDAHNFGLEIALGEFILCMSANDVLLPKTIRQQISYFTESASTLDILLSGYRVVKSDGIVEYIPWQNDFEPNNLPLKQPNLWVSILANSSVLIRRQRLELESKIDSDSNLRKPQAKILINLISQKGCRVSWLKLMTQANYPSD